MSDLFREPDLVETEGGFRTYEFGGEKYPSITSVLAATSDDTWLKEWRARVGEEDANARSAFSSGTGTEVHALFEALWLGRPYPDTSPIAKHLFGKLSRAIANRVKPIAVEIALYSRELRVAGRTDLLCLFDGIPTILDYKTNHSDQLKAEDKIEDYKIQTAFYARCVREITGRRINQGVIAFANRFAHQIVVFDVNEYQKKLEDRVDLFYRTYKMECLSATQTY